jgi:hypothetical protein
MGNEKRKEMKKEEFIGVWKLVTYGEGKISTSMTHIVVKEKVLWEVWPDTVYYENDRDPILNYNFQEGYPAKLSLEDGFKYLVKKSGDTLLMKLGPVYGSFPESFEDSGNLGEYILEDPELSKTIALPPVKVKILEHKMRGFGTLRYDENLDSWTCSTKFQGKKIKLDIAVEKDSKFEPLDRIKDILKNLEVYSFHTIAADHLLSLYNDSWNEKKTDLTHKKFASKIELTSITIETDGEASIWFKDGNLFLGHLICVSLDPHYKVRNVGIMG